MVLTNTTAGFRASPKSHLVFEEILNKIHHSNKQSDNFLLLKRDQYNDIKKLVECIGGHWQIPIIAEKGDFIIWTSTTIHSAILQDHSEKPIPSDKWKGWRGVVYICYRPREEFTKDELIKKYDAFKNNKVTNHWGTKIFPCGISRYNYKIPFTTKIKKYILNPSYVYKIKGMNINLTEEQEIIMGKYV